MVLGTVFFLLGDGRNGCQALTPFLPPYPLNRSYALYARMLILLHALGNPVINCTRIQYVLESQ